MQQQSAVLDHEALQTLENICIPPCPAILTMLMQEMRADEPDFPKISKLICSDASLAAAMLQTVNSPFYGIPNKATSVQQAIALLGFRNVAQLATSLMLRSAFPDCDSELMEEYWASSSTIARISAVLAKKFKGVNRDEAYTFALFRDCGMLAMMDSYTDYVPVFAGAETPGGIDITSLEHERHQMNHAQVGYNLAKMWLLPEGLCQSVLWHHDYAVLRDGPSDIPAASVRHIALALVAEWIFVRHGMAEESPEWRKGGAFAREVLKLGDDDMEPLLKEVEQCPGVF